MKKSKKKKTRPKKKENPLLIRINSPAEQEKLWQEAKNLMPGITRKEFDDSLSQYIKQHGCLPNKLTAEDVKGIDPKTKILIAVGNVKEIHYIPEDKSRKAPYAYYHKTKDERLLTDAKGKALILHGKTKLANTGKNTGWLVD